MSTSRVISVTMPSSLADEAERLARAENRTVTDLFLEALRRYQRQKQRWHDINAYGQSKAAELGLTGDDVVPLVREYRREKREKTGKESSVKQPVE